MTTNDHECQITKHAPEHCTRAFAAVDAQPDTDPRARQCRRSGIVGQPHPLQAELATYEAAMNHPISTEDLPLPLVVSLPPMDPYLVQELRAFGPRQQIQTLKDDIALYDQQIAEAEASLIKRRDFLSREGHDEATNPYRIARVCAGIESEEALVADWRLQREVAKQQLAQLRVHA